MAAVKAARNDREFIVCLDDPVHPELLRKLFQFVADADPTSGGFRFGLIGFFRIASPLLPTPKLQQQHHHTAHHVGEAFGHETVAEPENICSNAHYESNSIMITQQIN